MRIGARMLAFVCVLVLLSGLITANAEDAGEPIDLPLAGRIIGIDPGHQLRGNYGKEAVAPGSKKKKYKVSSGTRGVSTKVPEYVQNLRIGLKLKAELERRGAKVAITRTKHDVNLSNKERAQILNFFECDLVLRLHCNAAGRGSYGIGIYYSTLGTGKLNKSAANYLKSALKKGVKPKKIWITKTREFTGLNWSMVPSLLIEMGFMSNPTEDRQLNNAAYQDRLVSAMADGAEEFCGN